MNTVRAWARMVALSHTIFALPFALASALLVAREARVTAADLGLVLVCMVAARSSAMGFNRIADRAFDAKNPRTAQRELPAGAISVRAAWAFTIGAAAVFVGAAAVLGRATLLLAPVALVILWGYSLTKRFTALCHGFLGLALGLAPTGVWIALTDGGYGPVPLVLSFAVGTWVAGFDVIYACQDVAFDREHGLHSLPAAIGVGPALAVSAVLHLGTLGLLSVLPLFAPLGWAYGVGVVLIAAVLAWEHWIVRPGDLTRVNKAFFDLNGWVSLLFLAFVAAGVWW